MKKLCIVLVGIFAIASAVKLPPGETLTKRISRRFKILVDSTPIVDYLKEKEMEVDAIKATVNSALDQYQDCPQLKQLMEVFNFTPKLLDDILEESSD